jgi:site-specific DNA-methyltransferase (adenine-specific)
MEQKHNKITEAEDNIVKPNLHKAQCCVQPFSVKSDVISELYNMDCVAGMKHYPDKYFDLAIVDPPYDFSTSKTSYVNKNLKFKDRFQRAGGNKDKGGFVVGANHKNSLQSPPDYEYYTELFRVSKHRIIWGGNTFADILPPSMEWIFWDKRTGESYFADGELAWTSFNGSVKMFRPKKLKAEIKIHPTQKPIELYEWILSKYAEKGQRILDTHVGSGSSRIACYLNGFDFVGFEIDKQYCEASEKRFVNAISQQRLSF